MDKRNRFLLLKKTAKDQLKSIEKNDVMRSIKKQSESTYIDADKKPKLSEFNQNLTKALNSKPPKEDN